MRRRIYDKKLLLLLALLFSLVTAMVLIWRHYDIELRKIDKQSNELKQYTD